MKKIFMLCLVAGLSTSSFAAGVYKCVNNGSVTYQSRPCAGTITPNQQLLMQQKLAQKTATQNARAQQMAQPVKPIHQYTQQEHLERKSSNGTKNEIPNTAEGKKKSLALAQDAYRQTKNR